MTVTPTNCDSFTYWAVVETVDFVVPVVFGPAVVGLTVVVGPAVVTFGGVVGATVPVVKADVIIDEVVGAAVVGAAVDGAAVDGAAVVGAAVDGAAVVGAAVDGAAVVVSCDKLIWTKLNINSVDKINLISFILFLNA